MELDNDEQKASQFYCVWLIKCGVCLVIEEAPDNILANLIKVGWRWNVERQQWLCPRCHESHITVFPE